MTRRVVGLDVSAIPDDPRGAGRYVTELVAALDRRDNVDRHLLARKGDGDRWSPFGAVSARVPVSRWRRLVWEQVGAPRFVNGWGIDVYHAPHYTMPERTRVPTVVTIHDLTFFDHPEWHEKVKVAVFTRAIRAAVRLAAALVCVSGPTARRLTELLDPQCPIHVIPHGIDHGRFTPALREDDVPTLAALGVVAPYVAFVGTLEPRKDVATLVAAFDQIAEQHPDLSLVIAGGSGWGGGEADAAVRHSPHTTRIVRTGYVADDALPALLRRAAAFVYAAREEGFGLPVLEGLACGAPTVTSVGSVMEELSDGAAVTVPAGDVEALAGALDRLVAGDPGQAARRASGLAVTSRYTWDATAAAHEAVYTSVAISPPRQ